MRKIIAFILMFTTVAAFAGPAVIWFGNYAKILPQGGLTIGTDNKQVANLSVNPIISGYTAPIGSIGMYNDGVNGSVYVKTGPLDTDWNLMGASSLVFSSSSVVDNAISRWDGATGTLLQGSSVILDDSDNITGVNDLSILGTLSVGSLDGVLKASSGVVGTGSVSLTSDVNGVLPLANGGTNNSLVAVDGGVVYSDANGMQITPAGTESQVLVSHGAAAPTWEGFGVFDHGALSGLDDDDHLQYHTDERADDRTAALLQAGSAIFLNYDDNANTLTISLDTSSLTSGGVTDHGALTGLADDDHLQYHTDERADDRTAALLQAGSAVLLTYDDNADTLTISVDSSSIDHGQLSGLADDDHLQYHTDERADDRTAALLQAGSAILLNYDDNANTLTISVDTSSLVTDHGSLTGLLDDDHTQYHTDERADDRTAALLQAGSAILLNYDDNANTLTISLDTASLVTSAATLWTDEDFTIGGSGSTTVSLVNAISPTQKIDVFWNGILLREGASYDYLRDAVNEEIDFNTTIPADAWIRVREFTE